MLSMVWAISTGEMHAVLASGCAWFVKFTHAAAPTILAMMWQGAVIALLLGLGLYVTQQVHIRIGAAQRFAVWAAAFAAITILPLLPLISRCFSLASAPGASMVVSSPVHPFHFPAVLIDDRWGVMLVVLWLMSSLLRAALLVRHWLTLRRLWGSAAPMAADANLRELLDAVSSLRRPPAICTTRELDRPAVIGFFAPRILIPEWLISRLTPAEFEHVVLHESEHLRRCDDWTNLLQKIVLVLFPLNPALMWIERRLCREREMACDEGVVRRTQAPRAYAASLANLAGHALSRRRTVALSLGAFERRTELARRIASLLARKPMLNPIVARALVGVAVSGVLAGAVELARCPQMVAFVPEASARVAQNPVVQMPVLQAEGDRVYSQPIVATSLSGVRALQTKAMLPAEPMPARRFFRTPAGTETLASTKPGLEADRLVVAHAYSAEAVTKHETSLSHSGRKAEFAAGHPQVVVFTAWEQIETHRAVPITDYDAGAAAQPIGIAHRAAAQNLPPQGDSMQITVTQLVFWFAPRAGTIDGRPQQSDRPASPSSGPNSLQPAVSESLRLSAPIPESGWLIFKL